MKVLFVSSGNSLTKVSPIIKAQGDSLSRAGVEIDYFQILGYGLWGYLKNVLPLRRKIRKHKYDLVHAHFSLSGFVASLAGGSPLVVSLMGWNIKKEPLRTAVRLFNRFSWQACIVKSQKMKATSGLDNVYVIPNGVDLDMFVPMDRAEAQDHLGWDRSKTHFLLAADPKRPIKNVDLAKQAFQIIDNGKMELHCLGEVAHDEMVYHYNASDVVFLTSFAEGSPNVIKEALACNCKVVSTDVGDVAERFGDNPACLLTEPNPEDVAAKLMQALHYSDEVNTRKQVENLSSSQIAKSIIAIYSQVISQEKAK